MTERVWRTAPSAVALIALAAVLALAEAAPARYKLLLQEDGVLEWVTAWGFAAATGLFARTAWSKTGRARVMPILLAAFCLFVAGEEISWGQRLLSYQPPELFLAENFQQESNLHNLLKGVFDSRWQVLSVALFYGLLAPLSVWRQWLPRSWAPAPAVVPTMLAVAVLELAYPVELAGEVAEALLALAFLHDAAIRLGEDRVPTAPRRALLGFGLCTAAGVATPPLLDATLFRGDPQLVALAGSELRALGDLVVAHHRAKLLSRGRIHKRMFTAGRSGYFDDRSEDASQDKRARYHLDPWQQPYWISFTRASSRSGTALIYSFGPNRRRDTLIEAGLDPRDMGGDDIAISVEVVR